MRAHYHSCMISPSTYFEVVINVKTTTINNNNNNIPVPCFLYFLFCLSYTLEYIPGSNYSYTSTDSYHFSCFLVLRLASYLVRFTRYETYCSSYLVSSKNNGIDICISVRQHPYVILVLSTGYVRRKHRWCPGTL